jgi:hypothetical protein
MKARLLRQLDASIFEGVIEHDTNISDLFSLVFGVKSTGSDTCAILLGLVLNTNTERRDYQISATHLEALCHLVSRDKNLSSYGDNKIMESLQEQRRLTIQERFLIRTLQLACTQGVAFPNLAVDMEEGDEYTEESEAESAPLGSYESTSGIS